MKTSPRIAGFSLIEMAFVLVIVTLLLGGLLVPFTTQIDQKRIAETQKQLDEIKEALIGYALSHTSTGATPQPFLPCPDAVTLGNGVTQINDGIEDRRPDGSCVFHEGNLPWVDLGVAPTDAWGNHFHYSVTLLFANGSTGFALTSLEDISVCSQAACPAGSAVANNIPALVLSYGKNGYGAINANTPVGNGTTVPCPVAGCSADERENFSIPANNWFVSRTITPAGTAMEFDDIVTWLSPNVLFNRMVAAGRLP